MSNDRKRNRETWKAQRHAANRQAGKLGFRFEYAGDARRIVRDAMAAVSVVRVTKESANV